MPAKTIVLATAILLTAAGVGIGVALHSPDRQPEKAPAATSLADVDTTRMAVSRGPFCGDLTHSDLEQALGGKATGTSSYSDGDSARLTGSVKDVAQEYGCDWSGAGAAAKAWVFAPPVTPGWARHLAEVPKGCARQQAPAYGRPTVAFSCTQGRRSTVSLRGLFGDAWLSCELSGRPGDTAAAVAHRADRWCLSVARAAA